MPLAPGERLGNYEVLSSLGAGGMGEVYRARDLTLGREVAIKLLLDELAADPERRARFEREARVLASLNHANVATLHGFYGGERSFLVMELVLGETLADRIARGPLPAAEAIPIFLEIAAGLEAAHDKGIVHRDLKPANVKVGPDGEVKILDFGLAKALLPEAQDRSTAAVADATHSPTLSYLATQRGEILGTAAYMSPEQASGRPVDKRTDVWAFGCCLYEALCGKRPFGGADYPEILASVLRDEPDFGLLPAGTPAAVRRVIARCLVKRSRDRLRDIGDARLELAAAAAEDPPAVAERAQSASRRPVLAGVAIGLAIGAAAGVLATWLLYGPEGDRSAGSVERAEGSIRSQILLPPSVSIPLGQTRGAFDAVHLALSPDGTEIVFVGRTEEEGTRLFRRRLSDFALPAPIPGTENAHFVFFSPDGRTIGFLADGKLRRVSLDGDDLRVLADTPSSQRAGWTEDGWIYWGEYEGHMLRRVRDSGGDVETIANLTAVVGDVLPDGSSVLLSSKAGRLSSDYGSIALFDLETLETKTLVASGYDARWVAPGHLVFGRGGNLLAVRFDPLRRVVEGDPVTLVRGVAMDSFFPNVQVAVSRVGSLVFVPGGDRAVGTVAVVDREGGERLLPIEPRIFGVFDLSEDDRFLALHVGDVSDYIWIHDLERGVGHRLAGSANDGWPLWSRGGDRLAFTRQGEPLQKLMVQDVEGPDPARQIFEAPPGWLASMSWAHDDSVLAASSPTGLILVDLDDPDSTVNITQGDEYYEWPSFSPDGRWLVHTDMAASGLWVRSYPSGELVQKLTGISGAEFRWCGACDEIFQSDADG